MVLPTCPLRPIKTEHALTSKGVKFSFGKEFVVPVSFILREPERWVGFLVALACMLKGGRFGLSTYPILYEVDSRQAELIINVDTNKKIKVSHWVRIDEMEDIHKA